MGLRSFATCCSSHDVPIEALIALQPQKEEAIDYLRRNMASFDYCAPKLETPEPDVANAAKRVLALFALGEEGMKVGRYGTDGSTTADLFNSWLLPEAIVTRHALEKKVRSLGDSQAGIQYARAPWRSAVMNPQIWLSPNGKKLLPWLVEKYQSHPDSGVHSASWWLL